MQQEKTRALLVFALLFSLSAYCQSSSTYSVGARAGVFVYAGDLTPSAAGAWNTPSFAWGIQGLKHLSPTLSARLDLGIGRLRADEASYSSPEYRRYRAFAFSSRVTEAFLSAEWSPLGRNRRLSPYLFAGLGYASMKITRDYSRFDAAYFANEPSLKELLARDTERELPAGTAILPVGLGLKYALNQRLSLTAEASQRFTRSDYLDGFSYAGNPDSKDHYTNVSVGLRYSFGSRDPYACPTIRY